MLDEVLNRMARSVNRSKRDIEACDGGNKTRTIIVHPASAIAQTREEASRLADTSPLEDGKHKGWLQRELRTAMGNILSRET